MDKMEFTQGLLNVFKERSNTHGNGNETLEMTADFWTRYTGKVITSDQVCQMMVLHKIARSACGDGTHADHYQDQMGYSALAGEISTLTKKT